MSGPTNVICVYIYSNEDVRRGRLRICRFEIVDSIILLPLNM